MNQERYILTNNLNTKKSTSIIYKNNFFFNDQML